jgi:hypothetical protein
MLLDLYIRFKSIVYYHVYNFICERIAFFWLQGTPNVGSPIAHFCCLDKLPIGRGKIEWVLSESLCCRIYPTTQYLPNVPSSIKESYFHPYSWTIILPDCYSLILRKHKCVCQSSMWKYIWVAHCWKIFQQRKTETERVFSLLFPSIFIDRTSNNRTESRNFQNCP